MKNISSQISEMIHDDIHTPKQNLFFTIGLILILT